MADFELHLTACPCGGNYLVTQLVALVSVSVSVSVSTAIAVSITITAASFFVVGHQQQQRHGS